MSISLQSGTKEFERLPCLKYYNIRKQENRLTGFNTAQNIDYYKRTLASEVRQKSDISEHRSKV